MEIIILGLLMIQNGTIYEMKKVIEKNFGNISSSSIGSMQAAVKKLLSKNMISFNEYVENSVNKKVYEITHEGKEYFLSSISEPMLYKEKNMELSKFFFMGFTSKSERLELVAAYVFGLKKELIRLEQIKSATEIQPDFDEDFLSILKEKGAAEIKSVADVHDIAFFQLAMLNLSIDKIKFEIQWFENFKENLLYERTKLMQNKTEYKIKKLSELNPSQVEQAVAIFIDGFYYIYAKAISKDKTLLKELFIDAFDDDMVFVCLYEERAVGFLGLGNSHKRCITLNKETCKRLFGNFKGAMIYMQMGGMLHEITVHGINEGYIDFITTDDNYRGKGIATRLIKYACDTLAYESYTLDVLSKNTTAKRLYEYLGFVQTNIKKNPLVKLGGFGNQIVMKLKVDKTKKGN